MRLGFRVAFPTCGVCPPYGLVHSITKYLRNGTCNKDGIGVLVKNTGPIRSMAYNLIVQGILIVDCGSHRVWGWKL